VRALVLVLLLASPALADDNPWVEGPEAPEPDEEAEALQAPREGDGAERLDAPTLPPDRTRPPAAALPEARGDLRLSTTLTRVELLRFGDQNLADAAASQLPGVWLLRREIGAPLPSARGHAADHLEIRLDRVPLLPASAYPELPMLGLLSLPEVERLTLQHGPRLGGGSSTASAGVLTLESQPLPRDLGYGLPLTGELRAGFGGADLEKTLATRAMTGYGPFRFAITGDLYDRDRLRLGRASDEIRGSGVTGGHFGVVVDLDLPRGLRLFSRFRGARHTGAVISSLCVEELGRLRRCVTADERGHDLLIAGADLALSKDVTLGLRAHAQRFDEQLRRAGDSLPNVERTFDETWRAGAVAFADARVSRALRLDVDAEWIHDRVDSTFQIRSRRTNDADPSGDGRLDPTLARRVDGATTSTGRATAAAELALSSVSLRAALEGNVGLRAVPDGVSDARLNWGGELTARARLGEGGAVFASLIRSARSPSLDAAARVRDLFGAVPEVTGEGERADHTVELGAEYSAPWLDLGAVAWAGVRSGPLAEAAVEDDDGARLVYAPGLDRQAAGVELRAAWRAPKAGLAATGTFGAVLVDDGLGEGGVPVEGVPPPLSNLTLSWGPPDGALSAWGRVRMIYPQARLSPTEQIDGLLCPESNQDPQRDPCRGSAFASVFDVGLSLTPSEQLRLDAVVTNLGDLAWRLHGQPLPDGGIGARVVLTLGL
jgi:hypothetical protein